MKKYYKYGEMLLTLREEYKECKYLLDELNKYINVKSDNNHFYFTGLLSDDDSSKDILIFLKKLSISNIIGIVNIYIVHFLM